MVQGLRLRTVPSNSHREITVALNDKGIHSEKSLWVAEKMKLRQEMLNVAKFA